VAEEELTPEAEQEVATEEVVEEVQEPNPVEALAAKAGWTPKDQWHGDPDKWKPADEFLIVGKERMGSVSKELKSVREQMDHMARTSAALLEQQLAEKRAEWESKFNSAVEEGDPEAARQARTQIDKLQVSVPQAAPPEGRNFAEKHSKWFGVDKEATAFAANRCDHYANMGLSHARQLQAVENDMKSLFPDLFPPPAKAAPAVAAPSATPPTAGSRETFHYMPKVAQDTAKDMVERGVIPNTDPYVKHWFEQQKRKVG
jgi:hypothetical protein